MNPNATEYILHVRKGVTWNNGDTFNADEVVFNLNRWCDQSAAGNSMAARMAALIDPATKKARDGAITKVDDHTVKLTLQKPDITIIPGMTDYPGLIVHRDFEKDGKDLVKHPIGTGAFELVSFEVGKKAAFKRRTHGKWWGGDPYLDGVEFIDYGPDISATVSAFESNELDCTMKTDAAYVAIFDKSGLVRSDVQTSATIVARTNVKQKPYGDQRVRNALQMAVDNATILKLGIEDHGTVGENFHVAPIHPEYYPLPKKSRDPAGAKKLMTEAGQMDFEHELITSDEEYYKNSGDAIAAQLREAGFKVKRTVLPGSTFWNDWTKYPYSITDWNMRPLGVQVLALAYRTGEAWNETAYSNPVFDAKLEKALSIPDPKQRKADDEGPRTDPPGFGNHHPALLADPLQPSHQGGDGLRHASPLRDPSRARMAQGLRLGARKVIRRPPVRSSTVIGRGSRVATEGRNDGVIPGSPAWHDAADDALPDADRLLSGQSRAEPAQARDQPDGNALVGPAARELAVKNGYRRPFLERYAAWLGLWPKEPNIDPKTGVATPRFSFCDEPKTLRFSGVLQGDLGCSTMFKVKVVDKLGPAVKATAILMFWVFVVMIPAALAIGVIAGMREGSRTDRALSILSIVTTSTPEYVSGVVLTIVFAAWLGWLNGSAALATEGHLELLQFRLAGRDGRDPGHGLCRAHHRASMIEVMNAQYIRTARLKGLELRGARAQARAAQRADRAVHRHHAPLPVAPDRRGYRRGDVPLPGLRPGAG